MAQDDPGTDVDPDRGPRGRSRAIIAAAFVLLVIAGLYAAAALYASDRVPADTRIGGVSVGGKSESEARQALEDGLSEEAAEPITVVVEGKKHEIDPEDAGLTYDYEASVDGLTGFSFNPVDLYHQARGGVDRDIAVDVDEDALADAVDEATEGLDDEPVEAKVELDGVDVEQTKAKAGMKVEREDLADEIADGWPDEHEFTAPTSRVEPEVSQDDIDRFVEEDLEPLVSGPVEVTSTDPTAKGADKGISYSIDADQLAPAVEVSTEDGELTTEIDDKKLTKISTAEARASDDVVGAKDAVVTSRGGSKYDVKPAEDGVKLDQEGVGAKIAEAMTKSGKERTVEVDSSTDEPDFTTAEARRTLPKEEISTFSTTLPSTTSERTSNIRIAAKELDGTYVKPGETFSLNEVLGERTAAKGYQEAGVIQGGRLANDYGGGISQLSTTLFNAVFFSGAKIEEFHPHSFYIDRYPEGREATISWPDVDNRFTNDTGAGILINAEVDGDQVVVSFDGRSKYDEVTAKKSDRRNIKSPKTITDDDEDCVTQSPTPGFSVEITRTFVKDGKTAKTSTFTTTYDPQDDVTCTHPDAD